MPLAFTIDGLKGEIPPPMPPAGGAAPVMHHALSVMRWAAHQGLRDASEDLERMIDEKILWPKIAAGVAAVASVLTLIAVLGQQSPPPRFRP